MNSEQDFKRKNKFCKNIVYIFQIWYGFLKILMDINNITKELTSVSSVCLQGFLWWTGSSCMFSFGFHRLLQIGKRWTWWLFFRFLRITYFVLEGEMWESRAPVLWTGSRVSLLFSAWLILHLWLSQSLCRFGGCFFTWRVLHGRISTLDRFEEDVVVGWAFLLYSVLEGGGKL